MPQIVTTTDSKLKYLPLQVSQTTKNDFIEKAYTVFAFASATLLIGLALRIIFALMFVSGPFARGLTIFTDPFITPFNNIFHDEHTMVQLSTGAAFSAYYIFYTLISFSSRLVRHQTTNQEPEKLFEQVPDLNVPRFLPRLLGQ